VNGTTDLSACGGEGDQGVRVEGRPLGPFATNGYVVSAGSACWIVDAPFGAEELVYLVRARGLTPELVVLTHAHVDHIGGLDEVRAAFPGVPVVIHDVERGWLGDAGLNLSGDFGMPFEVAGPDRTLVDGDELALGATRWRVIHTPGHSPGGITLYHAESAIALVGDTLFAGSIGRYDFPTSDGEQLFASIREKLYALPDETRVLPGHMGATTIGHEKATNPFVRAG